MEHEQENTLLERLKEAAVRLEQVFGTSLPEANQVRSDTEVPAEYTAEQIEAAYSIMAELGFGREDDLSLAEAGMVGAAVNIEGGKPNKIEAELRVAIDGEHGPVVLTGSEDRIIGADERALLGIGDEVGQISEFEASMIVASKMPGFVGIKEPKMLAFGYDPLTKETDDQPNGQAVLIGSINEQPVYALKVTRHNLEDGKYVQPNPGELALLTSKMLTADGLEPSKVASVTGGIYAITRAIDIEAANRQLAKEGKPLVLGVAAYGRNTMSDVTGNQTARPAAAQLISEVSRLIEKLKALVSDS